MRLGMAVDGRCAACSEITTAKGMRAHILGHFAGKPDKSACLVRVTNAGAITHWIYVRVGKKAKLNDLDGLLRSTWVECCGHLSSFGAGDVSYDYETDNMLGDGESKSMNVNAIKALARHNSLSYEYDFGTTTDLVVKLVGACSGAGMRGNVELAARNVDISYDCSGCGKKGAATQICTSCVWADRECLLCDKCVDKHEHGEDEDPVDETSFLPVVNSPRMGMCGYTG